MFLTCSAVLIRVISNSCLNVFQKVLTLNGQKSSVINFYTYLGLTVLGLLLIRNMVFTQTIIVNSLMMGLLGALGNYFIIKALSLGELSSIAPINSYKPVVALLIAFIYLKEIPSIADFAGIFLIITGTYFIFKRANNGSAGAKAISYRVLALIFSGTEAVFIKKIILLTNAANAFFFWAFAGFLFSAVFLFVSKHKPEVKSTKYQLLLILAVGIMQYSTNYVFSVMEVASALALFQLSAILSVFLGVNIFHEQNLREKLTGAALMVSGAAVIILL